jgi:Zn-dependent protease/CBS domain-containing protein
VIRPFSIGRVLGFPVSIDPSWFIIFFLILWSFSTILFPPALPGESQTVHFAMGLSATLLFFASLLGHELSHALVARAKHIPVDGITLFIFGGIARTRMEASTPGDEFQIAGVGPLASLVIAAGFGALFYGGMAVGAPPPLLLVAVTLGWLNLVLAIFNLLPGFPLDGGRILRSIVWKITGNVTTATRWASAAGQGIAFLLIGLGAWRVYEGAWLNGVWLIFIGWFLRNAARTSLRQHQIQRALADIQVREAMQPAPRAAHADTTLQELMEEHFLRARQSACAIEEDGRIVGIVTVQQLGDVAPAEWPHRTARDVMVPASATSTVSPDDTILTAIDRLRDSPSRRLLVVEHGRVAGLITAAGLEPLLARVMR